MSVPNRRIYELYDAGVLQVKTLEWEKMEIETAAGGKRIEWFAIGMGGWYVIDPSKNHLYLSTRDGTTEYIEGESIPGLMLIAQEDHRNLILDMLDIKMPEDK